MKNRKKRTEFSFIKFTLKKGLCLQVTMNNITICSEVKYLTKKLTCLRLLKPVLKFKMKIDDKLSRPTSLYTGRYGHTVSKCATKPFNLPTPEQLKPFCPFVFVWFPLHPLVLTSTGTKMLMSKF